MLLIQKVYESRFLISPKNRAWRDIGNCWPISSRNAFVIYGLTKQNLGPKSIWSNGSGGRRIPDWSPFANLPGWFAAMRRTSWRGFKCPSITALSKGSTTRPRWSATRLMDLEPLTTSSATSTTAWATYRLHRSCTDLCEEPYKINWIKYVWFKIYI